MAGLDTVQQFRFIDHVRDRLQRALGGDGADGHALLRRTVENLLTMDLSFLPRDVRARFALGLVGEFRTRSVPMGPAYYVALRDAEVGERAARLAAAAAAEPPAPEPDHKRPRGADKGPPGAADADMPPARNIRTAEI